MKIVSYLKGLASAIIWGLGQFLNKQWVKGLIFLALFAGLIGIELGTSNYGKKMHAYDKIQGQDYGDIWVHNVFGEWYLEEAAYEPFEQFIKTQALKNSEFRQIFGNVEDIDWTNKSVRSQAIRTLTEAEFISFLASDLKENNEPTYTNLLTGDKYLSTDFLALGSSDKYSLSETVYRDEGDIYYTRTQTKDKEIIHFIEVDILTGERNEENIIELKVNQNYADFGLVRINKTGSLFKDQTDQFFLEMKEDSKTIYLNLSTKEIVTELVDVLEVKIVGNNVYLNNNQFYDFFDPEVSQYKPTAFTDVFRYAMKRHYRKASVTVHNSDYNRLMLKVYFEINQEQKEKFVKSYDNFFYDKAGMFIRGYWAVITLGEADNGEFNQHRLTLANALIGNSDGSSVHSLRDIIEGRAITVEGHITKTLLLQGLIFVMLSVFFFFFMGWSITDAYKVSEKRRKKEEVLEGKEYFKNLWESSFEYIILSPAIFVLAFISIMPIIFGFIIAFTSMGGEGDAIARVHWVGLRNFFRLFDWSSGLGDSFGKAFWRVLTWTIVWAVGSTATVFFGGFIQALILNSEKVVFRKLWRSILILPWAVPAILSQMVFRVMFNETGWVNQILEQIGLYKVFMNLGILGVGPGEVSGWRKVFYLGHTNINWLNNAFNPNFVRASLIIINIWLGFPYFMALMSSVMTSIDKTLYEAAEIDGATGLQKIRFVTVPMVLYSTAPILIMTFSGNFNNFGVIYFITQGGVGAGDASRGFAGDTDILISWMYSLTVDHQIYNMASVFSILIFLLVGSLTAWNLSRTRAFQED